MVNTDAITDLFDAVKGGQLGIVKRIITEEINQQTFQNLQCTLLHQAGNNLHSDILQYLLDNHAFVDCRDANKTTPLMIAAHKGDSRSVRLLLNYGADVNAVDYDDRTPLYLAAYDGYQDCVKSILLDERVDITIIRKGGYSALHEASRFGHVGVTKILLDYGMDFTAQTWDDYRTPGHMAASSGRVECLKLLIDAGIDVNVVGGPNKSSTMLHEACHNGHIDCIQLLLESGADPTLFDGHEMPHHLACKYDHPMALDVMLNHFHESNQDDLVDAFTDADLMIDPINYNNAMHIAAYYGRKECLEVLLKHNAQNLYNGIGRTPEILTVFKLNLECLRILIKDMRKKNGGMIADRRGDNPLYYLCHNSYKTTQKTIACACILLNSGLVDVNRNDIEIHKHCLETAVDNGVMGLVRYLLMSGADPYKCDISSRTLIKSDNVSMSVGLVDEAQTEPKSLLLCSRIKIRELMLNNGMDDVYNLPLPRLLKDYIYHGHYRVGGLCDPMF